VNTGPQPAAGPRQPGRPESLLPGPLVSASWLAAHLGPPVVVLDATVILPAPAHDGDYRPQSARGRFGNGHIPGARHADLLEDLSDQGAAYHFARPPAARLAAALGRLGVTDTSAVVSYDSADGMWAARLWWMLRWIGVPAAVLDGGWGAWVASGGAVEHSGTDGQGGADAAVRQDRPAGLHEGAVSPHEGAIIPDERSGMWAGKADVLEIVGGARPGSLVCALSSEVFEGTVPTRYSRRGHIPSSLSVPARTLLAPDGRLRPPGELAEAMAGIPGRGRVTVYCGGGISAALVAHALTVVGREDVAIYDGSLEEWSADPDLPLVLGPHQDDLSFH
jgi:thiosulfate/3-mercaptopyruvate sulfurtransferase